MTSVVNKNVAYRPRTRTGFPLDRYGTLIDARTMRNMMSTPPLPDALIEKMAGNIMYC